MAKQIGPLKITGCYDNVCFYKMDGAYYARSKSSLTGKRVKKDQAFKKTMEYAGLLGRASKIASALYKELPKEKGLYRKLVGEVMQLLKEGKTKEQILGPHPKSFSQGEGLSKTLKYETKTSIKKVIRKRSLLYAGKHGQALLHRKEHIPGPLPKSLSQGEGLAKTPTKEVSINIVKERIAFANEIIQQAFHRYSPENYMKMIMAPP